MSRQAGALGGPNAGGLFLGSPPRNDAATRAQLIDGAIASLAGENLGDRRGALTGDPERLSVAECAALRDVCAANLAGVIVAPHDVPLALGSALVKVSRGAAKVEQREAA